VSSDYSGSLRPSPFVGSEFPDEAFAEVRRILLEKRQFDIGMYKDRCLKRRIAGRVRALGLHQAQAYLQVLRQDQAEVDLLITALTIHVSQFFRNPSMFAQLEGHLLPALFQQVRAEGRGTVRLWSAGCSSGEEAYSLALMVDALEPTPVPVDILATDLPPAILEVARAALFDPQRLVEVPEAVRERYFAPEGGRLRLREEVRRRVRFAAQNLLTDPDYPKADLILCRNVLIYFSREEQERILERFAAALPPGGVLVLGKAEMLLGEARARFRAESAAERIYRRN
jgi:chemotaxis protein methyltransferase CheR